MKCPACNEHELRDSAWISTEYGEHYKSGSYYDCAECGPVLKDYVDAVAARIALLEAAIREHREECWLGREVVDMFDRQLYDVLQEDKPWH